MKKMILLPLLATLVFAGCATFSKITPEFQAELDAQTPNTVTIYFGCANVPDKHNYSIDTFSIITDPEIVQEIQNKEYKLSITDAANHVRLAHHQEGSLLIGFKPGTTNIAVYKTEVNPQVGIFTGEFGLYLMTVPEKKRPVSFYIGGIDVTGPAISYTTQTVLLVNKTPGTYYYAASYSKGDNDDEATCSIDEISAQMWAELVEPRIGTYAIIGKDADPNFVRPPAKK